MLEAKELELKNFGFRMNENEEELNEAVKNYEELEESS